mmetsp:Transcript_29245/g.44063  ORF Transcript_29245/g.44063 Transcript_29245/m.44063 type:complete len:103 (+) Transcript_29245:193-501(+)
MSGPQIKAFGIKPNFVFSYILAAIGMVCLLFTSVDSPQWMLSLFILGSKFGISQSFNGVYVGNVMVFPAIVLSTCFGICNIFSRFMSIASPYVAELQPESIS